MDVQGARLLAARIRAGVRVGCRIEFTGGAGTHERLHPGDRGIVREISDSGDIVVVWERGFVIEIDPDTTPFQSVAA
jgi:hypothetical protein